MTIGVVITLCYGLLSIVGGTMGYRQARSQVSLIAGIATGLLLGLGGILMLQGHSVGMLLARVVTAILLLVFISRLIKTRKFMPAGLMVGAGVVTLISLFAGA